MKKFIIVVVQLLLVLAIGLVWQYGQLDSQLFSRPSMIGPRLAELWIGVTGLPPLWQQLLDTLQATLGGLTIGIGLGFFTGVILAEFPIVREATAPYFNAINAVPRVAWVPVLTMIFGFGLMTKVIMSGLIVFLVVFFNVLDAATHAPEHLLRNIRILGGSRWDCVRDVRIWAGLGALMAALPSAVALALVGVVFAESLAAENGLGSLMFNAMHANDTRDLMIGAIMLSLIGVVLALIVRLVQKWLAMRLPSDLRGENHE